jgi:hypothetical protein
MISIKTYHDYFDSIVERSAALKSFRLVSNEAQMQSCIRDMPTSGFPALIALVPSADSVAQNIDSILEVNSCLIYVVSKIDSTTETNANFLANMETTQGILVQIKNFMLSDRSQHSVFNHLLERVDINGMHTDPEYNYLGANGWSLSFSILTPGF